jgi:replicative DNA helicase
VVAPITDANGARGRTAKPSPARRVLPHNTDLEASILGGVIVRNEMLAELARSRDRRLLRPQAQGRLRGDAQSRSAARPIDIVTLEHEIKRVGKLDSIGGIAFLGELAPARSDVDNVRVCTTDIALLHRRTGARS